MGAGHDHGGHAGHSHRVKREGDRKRLIWVLLLVVLYMVAEVIGGVISGSLALLADAGHMLSDAGALGLSLFALWIARRPATPQRTYGYYRVEILSALLNGAALVAISIYIFIEAFDRLGQPPEVEGGLMLWVALGGLIINLAGLMILSAGRKGSLNMRGAWLHVLSDALGSIGAILAGTLMLLFDWYWADPVASILIGLLVLYSSWALLKETVNVLMEGAPGTIDVEAVRDALIAVDNVSEVSDLHVWTITSGMVALSAHVTATTQQSGPLLLEMQSLLKEKFGIDHTTIQIEPVGFDGREMPV